MERIIACCVFLIAYSSSFSQKKPLDHSVYDSWQHIGKRMISNDGKFVIMPVNKQKLIVGEVGEAFMQPKK